MSGDERGQRRQRTLVLKNGVSCRMHFIRIQLAYRQNVRLRMSVTGMRENRSTSGVPLECSVRADGSCEEKPWTMRMNASMLT